MKQFQLEADLYSLDATKPSTFTVALTFRFFPATYYESEVYDCRVQDAEDECYYRVVDYDDRDHRELVAQLQTYYTPAKGNRHFKRVEI